MGNVLSYGYKKDEDSVKVLLETTLAEYNKYKETVDIKLQETTPKPMKLKEFPKKSDYSVGNWCIGQYASYAFKNKDYWGGSKDITSSEQLTKRLKDIEEVVDKYIKAYEAVYEENKPIIEHNKAIVAKVQLLMQDIGIPNTYSESYFKTSRSRKKTTETKKAGYLHDLDRNIGTSQPSVPSKDYLMDGIKSTYAKLLSDITEKERQDEKERKEKEDLHKVALLRAKYTPEDANSSAYTLREAILSKDKYLHLAYWLERNRNDWNDGYDYAETGLSGFEVDPENEDDVAIYSDIRECVDSVDGGYDGRIFRDTVWNYGVLYGMVKDQSLISDLRKLQEWHDFT